MLLPPVHLADRQDLSVAGKRAGLDGERSGLFMEQMRIIKEMRKADEERGRTDEFIRPRYLVWENVTGALSSGQYKGADFRCVLEEVARVIEEDADIPGPPKGGWPYAGCILGDGWSCAWRVHSGEFWGKTIYADGRVLFHGTPQRRRRIALVADFGGHSAPEILFVRKGLSRDTKPSEQTREETPPTAGRSTNSTSYTLKVRGGVEVDSLGKKAGKGALVQTEKSGTLGASQDQTLIEVGKCLNGWDVQSKHIQPEDGVAESLYSGECRYGGGESYVLEGNGSRDSHRGDGYKQSDVMYTLNTVEQHSVCYGLEPGAAQRMNPESRISEEISPTLRANMGDNQASVIAIENHPNDSRVKLSEGGIVQSLTTRMGTGGGNVPLVMETHDD